MGDTNGYNLGNMDIPTLKTVRKIYSSWVSNVKIASSDHRSRYTKKPVNTKRPKPIYGNNGLDPTLCIF